jgi:hypothetical protein
VLDAGYTIEDMRAGLDAWKRERRERSADEGAAGSPPSHAVARGLAWSAMLFLLFWMRRPTGSPELLLLLYPILIFAALPLLTALGIPLLPRTRWSKSNIFKDWFWNSPLGAHAEKFLRRGRGAPAVSAAFRPTESVLGGAVIDLFEALPTTYRDQLSDIPGVIVRLQAHAARARGALNQLESVYLEDSPESHQLREISRRQLADSVSAIEKIRLDLLRLLGGDSDLHPTTTVLEDARRTSADLERLQAAQREVDRIAPPLALDLRPTSPA